MPADRIAPLPETASQTAGPYLHIGCLPAMAGIGGRLGDRALGAAMHGPAASGDRIALELTVWDGADAPVLDAMVEFYQADAAGRYPGQPGADPAMHHWARRATDPATGLVRLDTIRPGPVAHGGGTMAPHIAIWIVARGINLGLLTRCYFDGDPANAADPVLARIAPPGRKDTLIARRDGPVWRHAIRLQGPDETVFLDA